MMKTVLICLLFLFVSLPCSGYITTNNCRIDRALYDGHEQKTIVYGTIVKEHRHSYDTSGYRVRGGYPVLSYDGPDLLSMDFKVEGVIMGLDSLISKTISVRLSSFEWPEQLVSSAAGTSLILILDPAYGEPEFPYYLYTVVPRVSENFKTATDNTTAKSILSAELLEVLNVLTEDTQIRETLLQLAPVLRTEQWEPVVPHLLNKDPWVQRAAICALVYATEDDRSIKLAAGDIQKFISATPEDQLIKDVREGYQYAPYPLYQNYFFFINSYCWKDKGVWSQEEKEKDCRIMEKIIATGLIDENVLSLLNEKF